MAKSDHFAPADATLSGAIEHLMNLLGEIRDEVHGIEADLTRWAAEQ